MKKDIYNCPFCQAEEQGISDSWGISPNGWEQMREIHDKWHQEKR